MRKNMFFKVLFCFLFSFFMSLFNSKVEVCGVSRTYQKDRVVESYKKVDVISFDYDYITVFDDKDIYDNGVNIKNEKFYSGRLITLDVKEYKTWVPFVKESDRTNIYKYTGGTNGFDVKIACFDNKEGVYDFSSEGIFKIEYVFGDEVIYVKYVNIDKSLNYAYVEGDSRYENTSAYSNFSFNLVLEDAYNLKKNKYYYAFGGGTADLKWREFSVFSEEELNASKVVNVLNKELLVDIKDSDVTSDNVRKYFYVKIVNEVNSVSIVKSDKSFLLASKIQANVYLIDDNGNFITNKVFYKAGDVIKFKIVLNASVTFENMQFTIDGYKFMNVDSIEKARSQFEISYKIEAVESFTGKFNLKSQYSSNAIVRNNGINAVLEVISNADFEVDITKPGISFLESGGAVQKVYVVPIAIDEYDIKSLSYYVSKCSMAQGNRCLDAFDDKNESMVEVGNVTNYSVTIDDKFGKFNGENLALFVKVVDKAGNVNTFVKMGYIIDNVIVPGGDEKHLFNFVDIFSGSELVGKKMQVLLDEDYKGSLVSYTLVNGNEEVCSYSGSVLGNQVYECFSVEGYDFNSRIKVNISDAYGNFESYLTDFKFSTIDNQGFVVDDKVFNSCVDGEYDLEYNMFNYMKTNDENVVFTGEVFNAIYEKMNFSKIPYLSNLYVSLVYFDDDDLIVLEEGIDNNLVLPTAKELTVLLENVEKIKYCSIENCDIDVYLKYDYEINGISQSRLVRINYLDSTNKYVVDNFNLINKINVGDNFDGFTYRYISNLNTEINEDDIVITKIITFEDKDGNIIIVDNIDTSVLGKYSVSESFVYGSTGSFPLSYVVDVVDSIAPFIRLKGKERVVVRIGEEFIDPFVSVSDNYDKDLKVQTKVDPLLDVNKEGVYTISYWCEDSNGNVSDTITRTIVVLRENTTTTYIICGGIVLFTVLLIVVYTVIEVKRQRKIG